MHLSSSEIKRFYRIWFSLLDYVNQQRELSPSFEEHQAQQNIPPEEAVRIRDVLWEDDTLREQFIAENPADLSEADLALVDSWQHRVEGDFYIAHYLANYAVFIHAEKSVGYGVHGISDSIEEMTDGYQPILIKTVLIPFGDRIIYDSLLASYPIHFGSGIKSSLKDTYRAIQERGGIITSLPVDTNPDEDAVRQSNTKVLTAFQRELGRSGLSPKMMTEHRQNIADFANDFLLRQTPPVFLRDITPTHLNEYADEHEEAINWVSFKRFARFLRDTERQPWQDAEALLDTVKSHR